MLATRQCCHRHQPRTPEPPAQELNSLLEPRRPNFLYLEINVGNKRPQIQYLQVTGRSYLTMIVSSSAAGRFLIKDSTSVRVLKYAWTVNPGIIPHSSLRQYGGICELPGTGTLGDSQTRPRRTEFQMEKLLNGY